MATKPKPKTWEPVGLDRLKETKDWYSRECLDHVATFVGLVPPKKSDRLKEAILAAAVYLDKDLHFEGRPTVPEKRAALQVFHESLTNAETKLGMIAANYQQIDADSRRLLEDMATEEPLGQTEELSPEIFGDLGDIRIKNAIGEPLRIIRRLITWTEYARANVGEGMRGRKPQEAAQKAVDRLHAAWTDAMGKDPGLSVSAGQTRGKFLDFVRAALNPVLERNNLVLDLERAVRVSLYQ